MSSSSSEANTSGTDDECDNGNGSDVDATLNNLSTEIEKPFIGKKFSDSDEMFSYYKKYAQQIGFPVKRRTSKKGKDGIIKYATFTCARSGKLKSTSKNILNPVPSQKKNCQAKLGGREDESGMWEVTVLHLEHNHDLSPSKSRFFRCNREVDPSAKRQLLINDTAGIPLYKSFNSFVVEAGGHDNVPFLEKDCRNYIEKVRRLQLVEGDACALQNYFHRMQQNNSDFYYSIDLDEKGRLKNVFWADARSRATRREFGEVITFDTTYLTNKYDMPFAPFVGVNHHGQSILLGCALISSEDTETFTWLFKVWLTCMDDTAPNGIITDQDKAMKKAIETVFPNTRHRWCLWHIMKKRHEKLGRYKQYEQINLKLQNIVYDSQYADEFEKGWESMIQIFGLHENGWLAGLFDERMRWVPCFVKDTFWAGMSTTQRSESMNAFFDGYVHSKTTLKQFVEQYDNALASKVEKEKNEDNRSASKLIPCVTKAYIGIELRAQEVYTISKFQEFQRELTGKMYCDLLSSKENDIISEYDVQDDIEVGDGTKRVVFKVKFDKEECNVKCSCRRFELRGILCRHALAVLIRNNVLELEDKYILKRWRKDVKRCHSRVKSTYDKKCDTVEQSRFNMMIKAFTVIADDAADDQMSCDYVMGWINDAPSELTKRKANTLSSVCEVITKDTKNILDPVAKRKKGRPPSKRKESKVDSKKTKKRKKNESQPKEMTKTRNVAELEVVKECGTPILIDNNVTFEVSSERNISAQMDSSSWGTWHSLMSQVNHDYPVAPSTNYFSYPHYPLSFQNTQNTSLVPNMLCPPNVARWNSESDMYKFHSPILQSQQQNNFYSYEAPNQNEDEMNHISSTRSFMIDKDNKQ